MEYLLNNPWLLGLLLGITLLRNSSGVLQRDELKAESVGFGAEFVFLALEVPELVCGKTRVIEFLPGCDEVKDDAREFVGGGGYGLWCAEFRAHTTIEISQP